MQKWVIMDPMLQWRKQLTESEDRLQCIYMHWLRRLGLTWSRNILCLLGPLYMPVGPLQDLQWKQGWLHLEWLLDMHTSPNYVHTVVQWWFLLETRWNRKEMHDGSVVFFSPKHGPMTCTLWQWWNLACFKINQDALSWLEWTHGWV